MNFGYPKSRTPPYVPSLQWPLARAIAPKLQADVKAYEELLPLGLFSGVTTNPSTLATEGWAPLGSPGLPKGISPIS